jgi:hypothetical protein
VQGTGRFQLSTGLHFFVSYCRNTEMPCMALNSEPPQGVSRHERLVFALCVYGTFCLLASNTGISGTIYPLVWTCVVHECLVMRGRLCKQQVLCPPKTMPLSMGACWKGCQHGCVTVFVFLSVGY